MKVFISQLTKGKTDEEILKERTNAINLIRKVFPNEDIEVLESYFIDFNLMSEVKDKSLYFLGDSIQRMAKADIVVALEYSLTYRSNRVEIITALEYGKKVFKVKDDKLIPYSEEYNV